MLEEGRKEGRRRKEEFVKMFYEIFLTASMKVEMAGNSSAKKVLIRREKHSATAANGDDGRKMSEHSKGGRQKKIILIWVMEPV